MDQKIDIHQDFEINPADFSIRVVAFCIDLGLAFAGYFLSIKLVFPQYPPMLNPYSPPWISLWMGLFLLYQAVFSCGGRRSVGKALLGLRVVDREGNPLTATKAVIRSAAYLVSSILNLGFLWSLLNPSRQCWHDLPVGSLVVDARPKGPEMRALLRAGAFACMAILGGLWYWNNVVTPRYNSITDVAYAQVGLNEIKELQGIYHFSHGQYADNLWALAEETGTPNLFMQDMAALFDPDYGIQISTTATGYAVLARANDDDKTLIAFNGP